MKEENSGTEKRTDRAKKMLVWLGVASIAMFFAAFTSAYIVLQADHFWVKDKLPQMFAISTGIILLSSLTIYMAKRAISAGNTGKLRSWLLVTLVLGMAFTATQYMGWKDLSDQGRFFVGNLSHLEGVYGEDYIIMMAGEPLLYEDGNYYRPSDIAYEEPINERVNETFNISASFLYILSGLHVAHLLGGLIWLAVLFFKARAGRYSAQEHLQVDLGSIYWHFLDILWIYLYLFLLFIR